MATGLEAFNPLEWSEDGGGNEDHALVKAAENVIVRSASEPFTDRPMAPGFYTVTDFSVVSDQEGKGRMVSCIHGPHMSFGVDPGDGSEDGILTFNRLTYEGEDTDPVELIGGDFLKAQNRVAFFPIAYVGYEPVPLEE